MYLIDTIGELPGTATPTRISPQPNPAGAAVAPVSALALAGVAVGGVLLGALGLYAYERIRK